MSIKAAKQQCQKMGGGDGIADDCREDYKGFRY